MGRQVTRRAFVKLGTIGAAGWVAGCATTGTSSSARPGTRDYKISLAAYSLHRTIGIRDGQTPMLDMPRLSRDEFGIEAVELVNWMLASTEKSYLDQFIKIVKTIEDFWLTIAKLP